MGKILNYPDFLLNFRTIPSLIKPKASKCLKPPMNFEHPSSWTPASWRSKQAAQHVEYPDPEALAHELNKLKVGAPIVSAKEVSELRKNLAEIYNQEGFIIQVGDCAERFDDCHPDITKSKVSFYSLLGNLFTQITNTPSLVIGRIAGQYAKPRTELYEMVDGKKVLNFRGENVNGLHVDDRVPDPKRMIQGYFKSLTIMDHIRQIKEDRVFCPVVNEKLKALHSQPCQEKVVPSVFKATFDSLPIEESAELNREIYVSHEALLLDFEESLVRKGQDGKYYNLSSHFLWIGMRTNDVEGAHVEFFRGLENPIGIKISKDVANSQESLEKFVKMIKTLNPDNKEGKLILITRLGARYVDESLSKIARAVKDEGLKVLWMVDGVHGNTQKIGGYKTRKLQDIIEVSHETLTFLKANKEIVTTLRVLNKNGERLHGIHLENTPDDVTECLGGEYLEVTEEDLGKRYTSSCDPRLNFHQSIEVICELANEFNKNH